MERWIEFRIGQKHSHRWISKKLKIMVLLSQNGPLNTTKTTKQLGNFKKLDQPEPSKIQINYFILSLPPRFPEVKINIPKFLPYLPVWGEEFSCDVPNMVVLELNQQILIHLCIPETRRHLTTSGHHPKAP